MKHYIHFICLALLLSSCTHIKDRDIIAPAYTKALIFQDPNINTNGEVFQCKKLSREEVAVFLECDLEKAKEYEDLNESFVRLDSGGFSPGKHYTCYSVNMLGHEFALCECIADDQGQLVIANSKMPLENYLTL